MPCLCFCPLVDAFGRAWRPGKRTPTRLRPGKNLAQQLLCQGRLKLFAIFGFKVFHIPFMFPAFFGTMTSHGFHGSIVFEWLEPPEIRLNQLSVQGLCPSSVRWLPLQRWGDPPKSPLPWKIWKVETVTTVHVYNFQVFQDGKGLLADSVDNILEILVQSQVTPQWFSASGRRAKHVGVSKWMSAENWQVHLQSEHQLT